MAFHAPARLNDHLAGEAARSSPPPRRDGSSGGTAGQRSVRFSPDLVGSLAITVVFVTRGVEVLGRLLSAALRFVCGVILLGVWAARDVGRLVDDLGRSLSYLFGMKSLSQCLNYRVPAL